MALTQQTIEEIRKCVPLRKALIEANGIYSQATYYRWLRSNHRKLSLLHNLSLISMYLRRPVDTLIEHESEVAA